MAKRIKSSKSKHSESFYVIDDYYNPETKKKTTFVVERLGSLASLMEKYGTDSRDEVVRQLRDYVESLRKKDREDKAVVELSLSPEHLISRDSKRVFNIGYLYIRNILCSLGIRTSAVSSPESTGSGTTLQPSLATWLPQGSSARHRRSPHTRRPQNSLMRLTIPWRTSTAH